LAVLFLSISDGWGAKKRGLSEPFFSWGGGMVIERAEHDYKEGAVGG